MKLKEPVNKNKTGNNKPIVLNGNWEDFIQEEGLLDYKEIPIKRARIKGWVQVAFWFLRLYIVAMIILVIIGFARVH